jgi:hypothetical protein
VIPTAPVGGVRLPSGAGTEDDDAARYARPGTRRLIPDGRVARCTYALPRWRTTPCTPSGTLRGRRAISITRNHSRGRGGFPHSGGWVAADFWNRQALGRRPGRVATVVGDPGELRIEQLGDDLGLIPVEDDRRDVELLEHLDGDIRVLARLLRFYTLSPGHLAFCQQVRPGSEPSDRRPEGGWMPPGSDLRG